MEVSFTELKEKEIVNVSDGKKLGHIVDILFDNSSGSVRGIIVPGEKRVFRKSEDVFIPLERLKKIGDDVILVNLHMVPQQNYMMQNSMGYGYDVMDVCNDSRRNYGSKKEYKNGSYIRYRRIDNKKYK